jgi:hypothetical protein
MQHHKRSAFVVFFLSQRLLLDRVATCSGGSCFELAATRNISPAAF